MGFWDEMKPLLCRVQAHKGEPSPPKLSDRVNSVFGARALPAFECGRICISSEDTVFMFFVIGAGTSAMLLLRSLWMLRLAQRALGQSAPRLVTTRYGFLKGRFWCDLR